VKSLLSDNATKLFFFVITRLDLYEYVSGHFYQRLALLGVGIVEAKVFVAVDTLDNLNEDKDLVVRAVMEADRHLVQV
jgi:hypothetical protein